MAQSCQNLEPWLWINEYLGGSGGRPVTLTICVSKDSAKQIPGGYPHPGGRFCAFTDSGCRISLNHSARPGWWSNYIT
ncbi:MAG: hypothetical protein WAV90_16315 [Gordonia amarae]